ncbi:endo alpha-1,4 polygalactosaminidase [Burkholderia stagnalis]|uniref:endo alpha-1,4 polygalactosaminidase n=1 Tax=Burkholderia stagnalis TaxID=1503054 RepID=UPI000AB5D604|nr:endo alpha-1,4 polygalactosaminidase [Burkholderia stagnalis]
MRNIAPLALSLLVPVMLAACGGDGGGGQSATTLNSKTGTTTSTTGTAATPAGTTSTPTSTTPATSPANPTTNTNTTATNGPGFPVAAPWMTYYGPASSLDLNRAATTYRVMDIDLDPGTGNFTAANVATLKNNGQNKVLSYLNLGSCEHWRSYWSSVPSGFVSCSANTAAQAGAYQGYSDETWMNVGNADYQNLILNYVVPRLVAQGADGFYLDNLEIVEHGTSTTNGPCDAACSQGGLDLVRKIREKYPNLLIVMQNATSDVTRLGTTGGVKYASLLDGVAHEEVYKPSYDQGVEQELLNWKGMNLGPGGRPFWIATVDYVGSCTNTADASSAYSSARSHGFSPYVSDASAGQGTVCYWGL